MQTMNVDQIRNGWNAYDAKGEHIGDVIEVGSNYAPSKGHVLPKDLYIRFQSDSRGQVQRDFFVDVTKDTVESLGWDSPPQASWDASDRTARPSPYRSVRSESRRQSMRARPVR